MKSLLAFTLATALGATGAFADDFPNKTLTMVVPFAAGGGTDTGARIAAASLEKALGKTIVVTNVEGAGGSVGVTSVADAAPDGYTIGFFPIGPMATQPHARKVQYTTDSFTPICRLVNDPIAVLVGPDKFKSYEEMKAAIEAGDTLLSAGPAPGSMPNIAQHALANSLGAKFQYVPFQGGNLVAQALLAGKVDVSTEMASFADRFGLQRLAILGDNRHPAFPDTPSLTELGGPSLNFSIWQGVYAPAGLPEDVTAKLTEACKTAAESEEYRQRVKDAGAQVDYLNSEDFTAFYKAQFEMLGKVMADAGLAAQ